MRFHYFVPSPTSQDRLIPVIQFQQFIPEDRLASPLCSMYIFMDAHSQNLPNRGLHSQCSMIYVVYIT